MQLDLVWERRVESLQASLQRAGCASATYRDRYILIFGGRQHNTFFLDCWSLDSQTAAVHSLTQGTARAGPRAYHTVSLMGDVAWIVGGTGADGKFCDTWCFNVKTREWKPPRLR